MTWAIKVGNFGRDRKYKKKKNLMEMLKGEKKIKAVEHLLWSHLLKSMYVCVCVRALMCRCMPG